MLWAEVPPGDYWLEPKHPTESLAPFLAHCENDRLVNANPPWGFYKLKDGEEPNPAVMPAPVDMIVDAKVDKKAKATGKGKRRKVKFGVKAGERLTAKLVVTRGNKRVGAPKKNELKPGKRTLAIKIRRNVGPGRVKAELKMTDEAGNKKVASARRGFAAEVQAPAKSAAAGPLMLAAQPASGPHSGDRTGGLRFHHAQP